MHQDPAERYPDNRRFIGFVAGALRLALLDRLSGRAHEPPAGPQTSGASRHGAAARNHPPEHRRT